MEIKIITVGKIKEKYLNDGIAEYAKRLSRYCKLTFCQVPDEKTPDKASDALNEQIKNTEAERLMKHIREQDYVIALAIDGKMLDSVELSDATHRFYQVACFSQFLTKRTDMHIHRSCFSIKIISPYMTENLISGHDQTFVFHQILKKFKFFSGQFYFFLFPVNFMSAHRQSQIITFQFFVFFLS